MASPLSPSAVDDSTLMMQIFIDNAATSIGLSAQVSLIAEDEPNILHSDTQNKTIHISKHHLANYESGNSNWEERLDILPNNLEELKLVLNSFSSSERELIRKKLSKNISDLELESVARHELGHIYHGHVLNSSSSVVDCYRYELEADAFASRTPEGRKGLIRGCKRAILSELLSLGRKMKKALILQSNCTHPSWESRLEQVLLIDQLFNNRPAEEVPAM